MAASNLPSLGTIKRTIERSAWALVDQALFGGTNLLVNILLARWIAPDEYGAFVLAYAFYIAVVMAHTSLFAQPVLVLAPGEFTASKAAYIAFAARAQAAVAIGAGALVAAAGAVTFATGNELFGRALLGFGVGAPFMLSFWYLRRSATVAFGIDRAAAGSAAYMVFAVAGLYSAKLSHHLSAFYAFCIIGGASLIAAIVAVRWNQIKIAPRADGALVRRIIRAHKHYARWGTGSHALMWLRDNAAYLFLPLAGDLHYSGMLKALMNFIMPPAQVSSALSIVLLPILVRARGTGRFHKVLLLCIAAATACTAIYWGGVALLRDDLFQIAYGGRYRDLAWLLVIVGAVPLFDVLISILGCAIYAEDAPKRVFVALTISVPFGVIAVVALIMKWTLTGAVIGMLISSMAVSLAFTIASAKGMDRGPA